MNNYQARDRSHLIANTFQDTWIGRRLAHWLPGVFERPAAKNAARAFAVSSTPFGWWNLTTKPKVEYVKKFKAFMVEILLKAALFQRKHRLNIEITNSNLY
jgi:hypothetical protein